MKNIPMITILLLNKIQRAQSPPSSNNSSRSNNNNYSYHNLTRAPTSHQRPVIRLQNLNRQSKSVTLSTHLMPILKKANQRLIMLWLLKRRRSYLQMTLKRKKMVMMIMKKGNNRMIMVLKKQLARHLIWLILRKNQQQLKSNQQRMFQPDQMQSRNSSTKKILLK